MDFSVAVAPQQQVFFPQIQPLLQNAEKAVFIYSIGLIQCSWSEDKSAYEASKGGREAAKGGQGRGRVLDVELASWRWRQFLFCFLLSAILFC